MKILVVGEVLPWPETSGMPIRLANVMRGLARLGELDVFLLPGQDRWEDPVIPPDVPVRRFAVMTRPPGQFSLLWRLRWWAAGHLPSHFVGRDYDGVRARYRAWADARYDLVWFSTLKTYVPLGPIVEAPAIVDFDDLEDRKLIEQIALMTASSRRGAHSPAGRLREAIVRLQAMKNARCWHDLQLASARRAAAAVVCNDLDRRYLAASNAIVIPNGYAFQPHPVGRLEIGNPPTVVLPGTFRYQPNADAACWLVEEIAPRIRRRVPNVQVRLVGATSERVQSLHRPPEVVVTGFVPDIRAELARADVIAVPVRVGGGTRIKILEAFAHRIPSVSTSKGVEGISAVDGRDILLGDTPERFAEGCIRLLTDPASRRAITEAAHALYEAEYRWDRIHEKIAGLAEAVVRGG